MGHIHVCDVCATPCDDPMRVRWSFHDDSCVEGLLMIVDKVWKLTNTVRVGLDPRSSHAQRQLTFVRMTGQYLTVTVTSVAPERFFSREGLGQTD